MGKTTLGRLKYDPDVDWDEIGEIISDVAEAHIWFERDKESVNIVTDEYSEKAKSIVDEIIHTKAMVDAVLYSYSGMSKWAINARLN